MQKGIFYYRFYDKLDLYSRCSMRSVWKSFRSSGGMTAANPSGGFFDECREKAALGMRFARRSRVTLRLLAQDYGGGIRGKRRHKPPASASDKRHDLEMVVGKSRGELRCDVSAIRRRFLSPF
jgi:hypothetical protein